MPSRWFLFFPKKKNEKRTQNGNKRQIQMSKKFSGMVKARDSAREVTQCFENVQYAARTAICFHNGLSELLGEGINK
jgi:hypothetical protein